MELKLKYFEFILFKSGNSMEELAAAFQWPRKIIINP